MIGKLIAILHLCIAFFLSFYSFIIPKNFIYDYFYICILLLTQLLWILFNHECFISYFYKILHYPNYNCGNTTTLDDFKELDFFSSKNDSKNEKSIIIQIVNIFFSIGIILSISIVAIRSHITNPYVVIFVCVFLRFFYLLFNNATGYDTNAIGKYLLGKHYSILENVYYHFKLNELHMEINRGIFFTILLFWMYITYMNKTKLNIN
jgi:hypothetical protein